MLKAEHLMALGFFVLVIGLATPISIPYSVIGVLGIAVSLYFLRKDLRKTREKKDE
jgi:membrane protein implicated in regulation of membrane protease activity